MQTTKNKQNWIKNLFKINDFKYIFKLTLPLFIQTFFFACVALIGSLASTIYNKIYHLDGSYNGAYFYTFSKIISVYKVITFIPLIYQLGVLVLVSNVWGQDKKDDIPKILWSAFYISLIINTICYFILFGIAPIALKAAGVADKPIIGFKNKDDYRLYLENFRLAVSKGISETEANSYLFNLRDLNSFDTNLFSGINQANNYYVIENSEAKFAIQFLRITSIDIFTFSIATILTSSLQAIEKNKYAIIGVIVSIVVRTTWTYTIMFAPKNNSFVILVSLETIIGSITTAAISYIFVRKFILKNHSIKFKQSWNNKYVRETLKLGFPIALETGIWYIAQYFIAAAIPFGGGEDQYIGLWRAVNNTYDIFNSFVMALSFVTSVVVATEIGKQDFDKAHDLGVDALKIGFWGQLAFSILGVICTWPALRIYSIQTETINKLGYTIMGLMMLKALFDIGNLTTLRALWGVNDVWMPNLVALITMIGVQLSFVYLIGMIQHTKPMAEKLAQESYLILIVAVTLLDPIFRTILFNLRWKNRAWMKYAKKL
ncbi:hypothetical protein FJO69_00840 [[Mycoplasma] falconis]|uniref:Probable multidrug resistance protein NorM n=1 Tax=[Mycoplasma] falconis TaxID=92403 RepID=A0A501XAY3_9BACT|nr:MATE family efflux transporter [[Mycoplasma] falconis]TPE57730.1 hypothetical protein FJO69_00840 [[Mycoplasma] falconis]